MKTLRQLILEERCPYCNDPKAYVGLNDVECPNPKCKAFSQRQADDVAPKGSTSGASPSPTKSGWREERSLGAWVADAKRELGDAMVAFDRRSLDRHIDGAIDALSGALEQHPGDPAASALQRAKDALISTDWDGLGLDEVENVISDVETALQGL